MVVLKNEKMEAMMIPDGLEHLREQLIIYNRHIIQYEKNLNIQFSNLDVMSDTEYPINIDEVIQKLLRMGATTQDILVQLSYEDFEACGVPRAIAKSVANKFKPRKIETVSKLRYKNMTPAQLIRAYDPYNRNERLLTEIRRFSRGKKCIALTDDGQIDVTISTLVLEELAKNYPPVDQYVSNGKSIRLYTVDELPIYVVDENPIFVGEPLRNGCCRRTGVDWTTVPKETRQFLRIKSSFEDEIHASDVLDYYVEANKGIDELRIRYPETAKHFDKLADEDKLPNLKLVLSKSNTSSTGVMAKPYFN